MPTTIDPEAPFIQALRRRFQLIQRREGDESLRETFSTSRLVWSDDPQMSDQDKGEWLDALDQLEGELLPPESLEGPDR
jgi:hypothetical protein